MSAEKSERGEKRRTESEEDRNSDVGNDEILRVPVSIEEDGETVEEDDERNHEETVVRGVRLERSDEGELGSVDSLRLEPVVESNVGEEDRPPGEETSDGGQVDEPAQTSSQNCAANPRDHDSPIEDGSSIVVDVEVGEKSDGSGNDETPDGETVSSTLSENSGRLSVASETVERSRGSVEIGVTGGLWQNRFSRNSVENERIDERRQKLESQNRQSEIEGADMMRRTKDNGVDDGRESGDTSSLDGNDPRRSGGSLSVKEIRVVGVNDETDDEGTENVEENCIAKSAKCVRIRSGATDEFGRILVGWLGERFVGGWRPLQQSKRQSRFRGKTVENAKSALKRRKPRRPG